MNHVGLKCTSLVIFQGRGVIRHHICLFFGKKIKFILPAKKTFSVNVHDRGHVKAHYSFPDVLYLFYPKPWKIGIKHNV